MTRPKLNWFQLRFPQGLEEKAVLAVLSAFSGLPHRARLTLELAASSEAITHRLGVSPDARGIVTAALRAAVPSLRIESTSTEAPSGSRWLWQLSPIVGALRTDDLAAISAGLLSSLFPLEKSETVRLLWQLRPGVRPPLAATPESQLDGRRHMLRTKLTLPGLSAHGELFVSAASPARRRQLTQRTASVLRSLSTPHGRLVAEPYWLGQLSRLLGQRGRYLSAAEIAAVIGWPIGGPDLPGLELGAAKRLVPASDLQSEGRRLGTSDLAGLHRPVAISPNASSGSLYVLGPTGSGKSSLLKNLIYDDLRQGRGLVVLETNGDLIREAIDAVPAERIQDVVYLDATDPDFAVGLNPFAGSAEPALVADQIGELFQRLWKDFWGPRTDQLTHMGLLTLARRPGSTLLDLARLYQDPAFRARVLAKLDDPVGLGPDWQWFENLPEREQAAVTAAPLNKFRQFAARPAIRAIVGQTHPRVSVRQIIDEGKVLLVHLPKGLIGNETAQLIGCLVLTSVWQATAERAALPPERRRKYSLVIDELQDFAAAPVPWDEMFSQGRKYGLSVTAAHQHLTQIPGELRESILANARSKAVFALSAQDAHVMERHFSPALTAADLQALDAYTVAAQVALGDGRTARPVTLTTPPPLKPLGTARQVRAASRANYARRRAAIEGALRRAVTARPASAAPIGRKKRSRS